MRPTTVFVAYDFASDDRSPVAFARAVADVLGARLAAVNVRPWESLAGAEADEFPRPVLTDGRVLRAASPAAGLQRLIAAERPLLTVLGSAQGAGHGHVRVGGTA